MRELNFLSLRVLGIAKNGAINARTVSALATLRELSHSGSNRNADCGHFWGSPAICDRGWKVVEWECRQKLGSIVF